jgi:hypothetical protein
MVLLGDQDTLPKGNKFEDGHVLIAQEFGTTRAYHC